jgi:hypothetical protein
MSFTQNEDGRTVIMAVLLVKMMNPRCKRLHRELDEGLAHRDAITARQERPGSVFREPNVHSPGLSKMVAERLISEPECSQSRPLPGFGRRPLCNGPFTRQ